MRLLHKYLVKRQMLLLITSIWIGTMMVLSLLGVFVNLSGRPSLEIETIIQAFSL
jgi:hypothetical protein